MKLKKKTFKALALLLGITSIIAGCGANNSSALKKSRCYRKTSL